MAEANMVVLSMRRVRVEMQVGRLVQGRELANRWEEREKKAQHGTQKHFCCYAPVPAARQQASSFPRDGFGSRLWHVCFRRALTA